MEANENTIITCAECGCVEEDLYLMDGKYYCADCLERLGYVRCDECGEWIPEDEAVVYNDEWVCEDCVDRLSLEKCDECGEYNDECTEVIGRYGQTHCYCNHCLEDAIDRGRVFYCEDCETYYEERWYSSFTTHDGHTICENCYNNSYGRCYDCDEIFPQDELRWSDSDDCYYCESCYYENGHDEDHSSIHEYSFKPSAVFHGIDHYGRPNDHDPITMGFELEVDKGSDRWDCARELDKYFGEDTLYMKSDSSVDFEIVTHPHTLKAYMEELDFEKLCSIPLAYGYKSHDARTCGFHIHVGRTQLGACWNDQMKVIRRIAVLMYRMWPALVKFSRRTESQLDRWASAPTFYFAPYIAYDEKAISDVVDEYYDGCGRYQALNLCPSYTIEFRLWRGSLQPDTLKATIQLTSNIVMFAKTNTMYDMVHASWDDVVNYETCPELEAYLKERELESFSDTRDVQWANEIAEPAIARTPKFHVGDPVIISNPDGLCVSPLMVGAVGIVADVEYIPSYISDTPDDIRYSVEITERPEEARNVWLHDCNGQVPSGNGYFAYEENIAPWFASMLHTDPATQASNF